MKQPCVILELVCTFCVFSISFGQQQLGSADGDSITEVLPGTSEIHHPVVKCVAKSDEQNIVTVSVLESKSQENIVSLNIHTKTCVTTVNAKARIECQVQDPIYEIYAEIHNLAVGETRNYTCRKTYFDGRFSHKEEQLSLTARELDQVSSERVVVILLAVLLAVTLCVLIGSAVGFFVLRHYKEVRSSDEAHSIPSAHVSAESPACGQHASTSMSDILTHSDTRVSSESLPLAGVQQLDTPADSGAGQEAEVLLQEGSCYQESMVPSSIGDTSDSGSYVSYG